MAGLELSGNRAKLLSKLGLFLDGNITITKKTLEVVSETKLTDVSFLSSPVETLTYVSEHLETPITGPISNPDFPQDQKKPTSNDDENLNSRQRLLRKLDQLLGGDIRRGASENSSTKPHDNSESDQQTTTITIMNDTNAFHSSISTNDVPRLTPRISVEHSRIDLRPKKRSALTFNTVSSLSLENRASKCWRLSREAKQFNRRARRSSPLKPDDRQVTLDELARSSVMDHQYTAECQNKILSVVNSLDRGEAPNVRLTELLDRQRSELSLSKTTIESLQSRNQDQYSTIATLKSELEQYKRREVAGGGITSASLDLTPYLDKIRDLEAHCERQEKVVATLNEELKLSKNVFLASFKSGGTGKCAAEETDLLLSFRKKIEALQLRLRKRDQQLREFGKLVKNQKGGVAVRASWSKSPAVVVERESSVPVAEITDDADYVMREVVFGNLESRDVERNAATAGFNLVNKALPPSIIPSQDNHVPPTRRSARQRKVSSRFARDS